MRFFRGPLALLCLFWTALTPVGGRAETFTNPYRIPTNGNPPGIAVADLNGDGLIDIVYGDSSVSPQLVHVLLAQPGGGYLPAPTITQGAHVGSACRLFDTNQDSKPDLVCPSAFTFSASIVVSLGNGDGTFGPPTTYPLPTSNGNYFDLNITMPLDLNGDGIPDLIATDLLNDRSYLMLGDGHGGFRIVSTLNTLLYSPVAIDLNGDGKPDLVDWEGPYVALGNGDGTFGPLHGYGAAYDSTCTYADMDGDGHVDAVCGYTEASTGDIDGATHLIILHGNPDGSFNNTPVIDQKFGNYDDQYDGEGTFQYPIAVRDLNGDGILDIISASGDGYGVLIGQPGLKFAAPLHYAAGAFATANSYTAAFADMNHDGLIDIVAAGTNGVYISYGKKDGSFATARAFEVAQVLNNATFADFNGDGVPDVAATGDTAIEVSLGNGDGTFAPFAPIPNSGINFTGQYPATSAPILSGDFNGDGKKDILATGEPTQFVGDSYIYFGRGDGTFDSATLVPGSSFSGPTTPGVFISDVNKDGLDDIVSADTFSSTQAGQSPHIYVSLSNGDGSFRTVTTAVPAETYNSAFNARITPPALADFNNDGKLDAVVGEMYNVYVLKGHGDGSFDSTGTVLPLPAVYASPNLGSTAVATGDFDGDGNPDIAVIGLVNDYSPANVGVSVYYGHGDGTFSAPVTAGIFDHEYSLITTGDLNGDGLTDIVLSNPYQLYDSPAVSILHAQPGRTFAPEVNYLAGSGLYEAAIADVNKDGLPDLLFSNNQISGTSGNSVTVLLNEAGTPTVTGTLTAAPEPSPFGQAFTLTAALVPPSPATLSGTVTFSVDGAPVGSAALASNLASLSVSGTFDSGTHVLRADWPGDSIYPPVALSGIHTVVGLQSATVLTASPNPALALQPVTLTAAVTGANSTPTGSITFYDGTTALGSATLDSTGQASIVTNSLVAGTHSLTATYAGNATYSTSTSAAFSETVTAIPTGTTLTVSPNPAQAFQFFTVVAQVTSSNSTTLSSQPCFPNCTVTFTIAGLPPNIPSTATALVSANGTASARYAFAVGTYTFSATFNGSTIFAASVAPSIQQTVVPATTSLSLAGSPNPATPHQTVNLVGTLTAPISSESPSGTITYFDGSTPFGTAAFPGSFLANFTSATLPVSSLNPGTHTVTAAFAGDTNFLASTSASINVTILSQDFTITPTSPTLTIQTQHHTTTILNLVSLNGFADSLTLSCANLPSYVTCRPTANPVSLAANGSAKASLYVDTDSVLGYASNPPAPPPGNSPTLPINLALLLTPAGLFAGMARYSSRTPRLRLPLLLFALIFASMIFSGCGQVIYPFDPPPSAIPGTYTIPITATGVTTGISHTTEVTLIVTP